MSKGIRTSVFDTVKKGLEKGIAYAKTEMGGEVAKEEMLKGVNEMKEAFAESKEEMVNTMAETKAEMLKGANEAKEVFSKSFDELKKGFGGLFGKK